MESQHLHDKRSRLLHWLKHRRVWLLLIFFFLLLAVRWAESYYFMKKIT